MANILFFSADSKKNQIRHQLKDSGLILKELKINR